MPERKREAFMNDLQAVYLELQDRQAELNGYYDLLDEKKGHAKADEVVGAFLQLIDIPRNRESEMAALTAEGYQYFVPHGQSIAVCRARYGDGN